MEQKETKHKTNFEFCNEKVKTFKEDLICQQDSVHKSMVDNPLGFIVFYVLAILFVGFLFQLSQKDFKKKEKTINSPNLLILILSCIHTLLVFLVLNIAKLFNIEKLNLILLKDSKISFYLLYIISFLILAFVFFQTFGIKGLQIANFIFSFVMLFELCIKIAESDRFINWIGDGLDKSIRYLIMFVISLNATYFFTRITLQIIESQVI